MANAGTESDKDVAIRCRVLVRIYAKGISKRFAAEIGISSTRWNNIESSGALSRDVARKITNHFPEVSLDWLYRGKDDGLTRREGEDLAAAFQEIAGTAPPVENKKPKKRASG